MHAFCFPLGQFRVGPHRLRVETEHQIDRPDRICQVCHLQDVETEVHFIYGFPVYYEIRGRLHFLFRDSRALVKIFKYPD